MKNDYLNTLEESDMLLRDDFELEFDKQRILFPIECWFDVDKKFGLNTQGNDGLWVNLYGEYNPCANEVKISYVINADDGTFEREYIPTDTERELFVKLMEQACEQYTGMTCRELYITDYVAQHASGFELECQSAGDKIAIINRTDNFVLYTEEKGGKLENHIRVQLFGIIWTRPHQAPLSMRFSRQGYWSGLPCSPSGDLPAPGIESIPPMSPAWVCSACSYH